MKQLFILFFVLLGAINGRAQTLENFRSVNNIRAMAIDAQGNKWLGTQRGLFKYDGTNFTQYTTQNGLYQNLVGGIAIDAQGILWLANGALTRFDGTTFTHYTEASTDTYTANQARCVAIDAQGNKWIGMNMTGLCVLRNGTTALETVTTTPALPLYPTPAQNTLNFPTIAGKTTVEIYDAQGKLYISQSLSQNNMDISSLCAGIYIVKTQNEKGRFVNKIVVE
jgi:ligand-binding sensor domain-containing protein